MFYVYILELQGKSFYTGFSSDLRSRLYAHLSGSVPQTKKKLPLRLVYYSAFVNKKLALSFEKYLKTSSGHAFRNKRLV